MAEIEITKKDHNTKVERRVEAEKKNITTAIWQETASIDNPYLAESCRCYGYDLFELMEKCCYSEVLYLLFRGELPNQEEADLLEKLQIAIINPGIRHPAVQAAMSAATSHCDSCNILPIGLSVLGGEHLGSAEVEKSMYFLKKEFSTPAREIIDTKILPIIEYHSESNGDIHPIPGFGSRFGGIDPMATKIAERLHALPAAGSHLQWGRNLLNTLQSKRIGWLMPGLVAATLLDLGFHPRTGAGMYQLLSAPGLLAHAWEYAAKPFNSLPFPDDSQYFIEEYDGSI